MTQNYLDIIMAGPQENPTYVNGNIGPSFLTPEQQWFRQRTNRRVYGEGDPDAGGYQLSRIHWNKEDGTLSYLTTDAGPAAWYGEDVRNEDGDAECEGCSHG